MNRETVALLVSAVTLLAVGIVAMLILHRIDQTLRKMNAILRDGLVPLYRLIGQRPPETATQPVSEDDGSFPRGDFFPPDMSGREEP